MLPQLEPPIEIELLLIFKSVPLIVTRVPPVAGPELGEIPVIVGKTASRLSRSLTFWTGLQEIKRETAARTSSSFESQKEILPMTIDETRQKNL